ncbi:Alpha-galactosidase [Poriferisphaera corsica]|uniref:Alpha-galactosidase n=1 Tax=Poriferisphaera corsica TaxID=2528020 RepID=A0A517YQF0_9BACT|nr:alpha-glucosidase/alpha-galactosidase [Poriferisphaera corsica]QDU32444.1 Alpha-galactosidase [Poriferisphaera corsica]
MADDAQVVAGNEDKEQGHGAHIKKADEPRGLDGKFCRPIKVSVIGAGSFFTHSIMCDLFAIKGMQGGEVSLVDIDEKRLTTMHELVGRIVEARGLADSWKVNATMDRREALKGSDYIVFCVEVSGLECVAWDNDIPLKYGIDQCIGDTIGPGGLFKALRTVPVYLDMLKDAEEVCPDALILNYTNPMNILMLAGGRTSEMEAVGLCHSIQAASHKMADDGGVPYEEMVWEAAGINHMAWFTKLQHKGKDLYPILLAKTEDEEGEIYESDPIRYDMMKHFGAFMTESSGHLSEYLPYYRKRKDLMERYCRDGYRGESRFYASNWPTWRKEFDEQRQRVLHGEEELLKERSWEYASWIIESKEKDVPYRIYGNVMNHDGTGSGKLITNLPTDGCVEVACMVDHNGINATRYGKLPAQMAAMCATNMHMFDLAATACIEKSKEAAIHALLHDPLTMAVCSPAEIKAMTLEMFEVEKDYLQDYK